MKRRNGLKVSMCVVLIGAHLTSGGSSVGSAMSAEDPVDKPDPLAVLTTEERERLLAENADGSMVIKWIETPYERALAQTLADQQPGVVSELPDPLSFRNVVNDQLKPPGLASVAPVPHTPTSISGAGIAAVPAPVAGLAPATDYQSDHVSYSNLGGIVRIDFNILLNPPSPANGICNGTAAGCFWFNAADGRNTDGYYLHWGTQRGNSANGVSGSATKLVLSGYFPGGGFFGGIAMAGDATVSTGSWHTISLRMVETAQFPGWVSHWKIYLDNVEKGHVWIGGLFLDLNTSFWQEVYENDGPCTTARGASLFDNVTYNRLFDPVTYSVSTGTVSYDATCTNTSFQPGYGAAVDLRQTPRTVANGTSISF